jgi:hypothetical protein
MNTLAAFTSPLGALHFAHPSATSALFQSAADRTTTTTTSTGTGSIRRFEAPRRVPQPQPPSPSSPSPPSSPTGRASRFGFKRRTSRTTEAGNTTTTAATRAPLEISSPVFVSSSNPMACTAFLNSFYSAAAAAAVDISDEKEKEEDEKLDVPLSPVSLRACVTGTTTPLDEPERPLVGRDEIERRMSEWDDEHRAEVAVRVARADGRVSDELKRVGL